MLGRTRGTPGRGLSAGTVLGLSTWYLNPTFPLFCRVSSASVTSLKSWREDRRQELTHDGRMMLTWGTHRRRTQEQISVRAHRGAIATP